MRPFALIFALSLSCSASAVAQGADTVTYSFDHVSLDLSLPAGYAFNQKLEESDPVPFGLYSFVDPEVGFFAVEVHPSLRPEQRRDFLAGGWAERDLAPLGSVERVDTAALSLSDGSAFRATSEGDGYESVTVYTCDESRCYKVTATGQIADFEAGKSRYVALLNGIRFR